MFADRMTFQFIPGELSAMLASFVILIFISAF